MLRCEADPSSWLADVSSVMFDTERRLMHAPPTDVIAHRTRHVFSTRGGCLGESFVRCLLLSLNLNASCCAADEMGLGMSNDALCVVF